MPLKRSSNCVATNSGSAAAVGSPYQLTPARGAAAPSSRASTWMPSRSPTRSGRTLTYCGDKFGQCLFSKRQAADEGLAGRRGG